MELNDAQTIVDPDGDFCCLLVRGMLDHGCQVASSRGVHFLAEEREAELLEQFGCFHAGLIMPPG